MAKDVVDLYGRVFITGNLKAVTGLHIGGASGALEIGGVDSPIIRDPLSNKPYIPGSSLRGKMRSLSEKRHGLKQVLIGSDVRIHICKTLKHKVDGKEEALPDEQQPYKTCPVCPIFGVPGNEFADAPTRLIVRDVSLGEASAKKLDQAQTDLPYSEVKWEATIDRVTSAAVPRQIERVPAGAVFEDFEMVYSVYDAADLERLATVVEALQLLEDDYLGGLGSRGGGKIAFEGIEIYARNRDEYGTKVPWDGDTSSVAEILKQKDELIAWAGRAIPTA
jgi:CRISPR-associated protein Csm3